MKRKIESITLFFKKGKNKKGVDTYGYRKVHVYTKKGLFSEMEMLGEEKGLNWRDDKEILIDPDFVKKHRWFKKKEKSKMNLERISEIDLIMEEINITGTSLLGYFPKETTYKDLEKAFGSPYFRYCTEGNDFLDGERVEEKTKIEWMGRIQGLKFTIYDYKSEVEPEDNLDWHIGGENDPRDSEDKVYIVNLLTRHLKQSLV